MVLNLLLHRVRTCHRKAEISWNSNKNFTRHTKVLIFVCLMNNQVDLPSNAFESSGVESYFCIIISSFFFLNRLALGD